MEAPDNGMRAIHSGELLREEFLLPLGLTAHALAMALTDYGMAAARDGLSGALATIKPWQGAVAT